MEKKKERQRKAEIKKGQRTQKMMSFRCDYETAELLKNHPNKGRLLNDLVKEWWKSRNRHEVDYHPGENNIPLSDE